MANYFTVENGPKIYKNVQMGWCLARAVKARMKFNQLWWTLDCLLIFFFLIRTFWLLIEKKKTVSSCSAPWCVIMVMSFANYTNSILFTQLILEDYLGSREVWESSVFQQHDICQGQRQLPPLAGGMYSRFHVYLLRVARTLQ